MVFDFCEVLGVPWLPDSEKGGVGQVELGKEEHIVVYLPLEDFLLLRGRLKAKVKIKDFLQRDGPRKLLEGGINAETKGGCQRVHIVSGRQQMLDETNSLRLENQPLQVRKVSIFISPRS